MIFGFYPEILEDRVGPEAFHVILHRSASSAAEATGLVTQFSTCPCRMG